MTQTQDGPDLATMTGLEQLQALADGVVPPAPIAETIGMTSIEVVEEGSVAAELVVEPRHFNPIGSVHGGVHSTLLDTVCACSVHSTLAVGERYTSLDLSVRFLRGVDLRSGTLRAVGTVVQRGRRTAMAEGRLLDGEGRLVAHATSTCLIFPAPQ